MIYVVNVDIEVEAATPELAEDIVMNAIDTLDGDYFCAIKDIKEIV